ncbi:MAG: phosphatase PAP2 family protein [Flavitalea sp.]
MILLLISLTGFSYLVYSVFSLQNNQLDIYVFNRIAPHITETNTRIMLFFTFLGSREFLMPANIVLALYFLFPRRSLRWVVAVPVIALGAVAVNLLLKYYFLRPRPLYPLLQGIGGYSFPSGHSMSALTFYGLLIYIASINMRSRPLKGLTITALAVCILLVGFSRIYFRVHYTTDVLGGFATGAIWLIISLWVLNKIEHYNGKRSTATAQR